ncbi:sulfatase-like hydrolase/transferase [Haloferula sp. A504]|uniref:sulfatase-like hydrolase/transferase n=1 Tax=Haloferula sp. A504 TaxID=3373601 RepID=UPI0031C0382A|nr:sulfatase-like hydrolase/transferase [Verrucomicrobiaceae bacterium E54]
MISRLATLLTLLTAAIATAAPKRPNVLFLFTDDQRHDTIQALGNERIQTPHIDRLVNGGLSFTNAYIMGASSMAVCTPSRACLFSGRTLWNLESQGLWDFEIAETDTTLTQAFRQRGYTTFATGKNDPGFGKNGHFSRSFSTGSRLYDRGGHRGQNRTPLFNLSPDGEKIKLEPDGRFNAEHFADACVEFLNSRKDLDEPFFAYVSFMTPHDPLNCPEEFLAKYEAGDMKLPANFRPRHPFDAGVHNIRDEKLMKLPRSEDKVLERLARYYALVTHTDAQIGRILEALEESGHAANTLIVFSSDNGLALGSHGLMGKQNVYEHSVKVPFIISGPGIPAGETRDQLCYIYDIFPTLCEMAGVEIPENVEYKSLKPVITDAEATHRDHLSFAFMQWHRAVRDERHKLIEYAVDGSRHTQLFDLKEDPHELDNLADDPAHAKTLARLRELLEKERVRLNDGTSSFGRADQGKEFWSTYATDE